MDLIRAGVGGKTLQEARENISENELELWLEKQNLDGPLNIGIRIDRGFALIAYMIYSALQGKEQRKTMQDFMPPWYQSAADESGGEPTFDEVMRVLGGVN